MTLSAERVGLVNISQFYRTGNSSPPLNLYKENLNHLHVTSNPPTKLLVTHPWPGSLCGPRWGKNCAPQSTVVLANQSQFLSLYWFQHQKSKYLISFKIKPKEVWYVLHVHDIKGLIAPSLQKAQVQAGGRQDRTGPWLPTPWPPFPQTLPVGTNQAKSCGCFLMRLSREKMNQVKFFLWPKQD